MSIDFDAQSTSDEQPEWLAESMMGDEPPDDDGDNNRLFTIIAIGLAGLIILGLFAVGGLLFIRRTRDAQLRAQFTPTPAQVVLAPDDVVPTPTFTPTAPPATATTPPTAAATNTRVVQNQPGAPSNGVPAGSSGGTDDGTNGGGAAGPPGGGGQNGATATPVPTDEPDPTPTSLIGGATEVPNTGVGGLELALIAIGLVAVLVISRRLRHTA